VIDAVALSRKLIGKHTPFLEKWMEGQPPSVIEPALPAVTCCSQYTYLTGKTATEHGIVGNGWYFRDECEVKFWRQSNKLVQAPKVWEQLKTLDPNFTCANMFWWYNMYTTADYAVTPRPLYPADGRKLPDCHTQPMELRDRLQQELGQFPLFSFWGPRTNISASKWIAEASKKVAEWHDPTLTLIYLPHLDYNLQRKGTDDLNLIAQDLQEIDSLLQDLIQFYEQRGAQVILLAEYGITSVKRHVHINRLLRQNGLIQVKDERGTETLDAGTSKAFAVADHQVAHVYVNDEREKMRVKSLLESTPGIAQVLDEEGKKQRGLDHSRAGELVAIAEEDCWFTYYFWLDDAKAPDFARTVDIHRKPGYDPVEMFTDPEKALMPLRVIWKLIKKKLGFRTLLNIIPLKAELIRGSHGTTPKSPEDWPIFFAKGQPQADQIKAQTVYNVIFDQVKG